MAQQATQFAGQAANAAAPVAQVAGYAAWRASRKGMGWFASMVTLGGHAAFAEIAQPQAAAEGQIISQPTETTVPAPVEGSALFFIASLLLIPILLLAANEALTQLLILIGLGLLLLVLNFIGLRRPLFSRLTFGWPSGRPTPELRLQLNDIRRGAVEARLIGARHENTRLAVGQLVRLFGVWEGKVLRTWQIDVYAADGQPLGIVTAPRTLPLFAMLFLPLLVWFVIWLLAVIIP
jgi:hypothetical protein